jgi:hypothetical protein
VLLEGRGDLAEAGHSDAMYNLGVLLAKRKRQ